MTTVAEDQGFTDWHLATRDGALLFLRRLMHLASLQVYSQVLDPRLREQLEVLDSLVADREGDRSGCAQALERLLDRFTDIELHDINVAGFVLPILFSFEALMASVDGKAERAIHKASFAVEQAQCPHFTLAAYAETVVRVGRIDIVENGVRLHRSKHRSCNDICRVITSLLAFERARACTAVSAQADWAAATIDEALQAEQSKTPVGSQAVAQLDTAWALAVALLAAAEILAHHTPGDSGRIAAGIRLADALAGPKGIQPRACAQSIAYSAIRRCTGGG